MSNPHQTDLVDQALVKNLPYPLYVVDGNLVVRRTNSSAAELERKFQLGNVLPAEVRGLVNEAIVHNHELGEGVSRCPVFLSNGRTYLPHIFRLAGIFNGQDGWAVLLLDGTSLGENVELRATTLSNLSHEVRTPLTSIRLSLLLLLEEKLGTLNPAQRELLELGRDECEQMLVTLQSQLELLRRRSETNSVARPDRTG